MLFNLFIVFLLWMPIDCGTNDIEQQIKVSAYGEGLSPDQRALPVHYFYLQFQINGNK
jgi:hypothetical protein